MEEQGQWRPVPPDWRWLLLLVFLTTAMRVWQVTHTEVPSRDSIGFIRLAWDLGQDDWRTVVRTAHQHPAYPAAVLAMSVPVRHGLGGDDLVRAMLLSAQLVSALAGVLLVVPMFYLGSELFDRRIAFWAALLFQCLPATGKLMADGLSEPLFLLASATCLAFAVRGLRRATPPGSEATPPSNPLPEAERGGWIFDERRSAAAHLIDFLAPPLRFGEGVGGRGGFRYPMIDFLLSGLAGGLAYLTRAEGALVPLSVGLALLGLQIARRWGRPWAVCLRCGTGLSLGALAVALPFMLLIGGVTVKPTGQHLMGKSRWDRLPPPEPVSATPHAPLPWAIWWIGPDITPQDRYLWAFFALGFEANKGFFYFLWLPALLGLWWFRDRFHLVPGTWALLVLSVLLTALLYRLAQWMGYVSARHMSLIVMLGTFWAVAVLDVCARALAAALARARPGWSERWWLQGQVVTAALLLVLIVAPLSKTLATLHADRVGFRQAGAWLARHAAPDEEVVDPYTWSSYYAGRIFRKGPLTTAPTCYVVLERSDNPHDHLFQHVPQAIRLADLGKEVKRFTTPRRPKAAVCVYRVRRP